MGLVDEKLSSTDRVASPVVAGEPGPDSNKVNTSVPIGKQYGGRCWRVEQSEYIAYAEATDDVNEAYRGKNAVAPPMFHVRPFIHVLSEMASDPELKLDMLRLVHAEHDMTFHRVLKDGDILEMGGSLEAVLEKSSGTLVKYRLVGRVDGAIALEGATSYFIRAKRKDLGEKRAAKKVPVVLPEPDWCTTQRVQNDQAIRYAKASGDNNPIHIDESTAKAAGLPSCILHGLCTMAFAQRDIVREYCGGDPSRLRRIAVRWARPVFAGDALQLKVWSQGEGKLSFLTENEAGQVVMSNGLAEIRSV